MVSQKSSPFNLDWLEDALQVTTSEELLKMLEEDEGPTLDFKDSRILSDPFKIARVLTAFANAEGGTLIIGIKDDKSIEGMKAKKGHEEHIMNIASDRCDPRLVPKFQKISIHEKGDAYIIRVREREGPYHAVKTKDGYKFFARVGSTIREMLPSELSIGEQGVEIPIESGTEKFWSWLGKKILRKFYGRLDVNILKFQITLAIITSVLVAIPFLLMFRIQDGKITVLSYPTETYYFLAMSLFAGAMLSNWLSYLPKTKCPSCKSYFSFHTTRKWVFEKRPIREGEEEWKTRSLKRCDECGHEALGKMRYERVSID